MQPLDRPAATHELRRQPVEQLRVRRCFAAEAEVRRGRDEALAEMPLPDAVDHHACCQRIVGRGHPVRQFPPSAAAGSDDKRHLPG